VALDWTFDLLFGRDYVQLGVHRHRGGPAGRQGESPADRELIEA